MTGADVKLTDEQVELVQRLQRGQFGDVRFNPYEVGDGAACSQLGAGPAWASAPRVMGDTWPHACVPGLGRALRGAAGLARPS